MGNLKSLIYSKLLQLTPDVLTVREHKRLSSLGFMDLGIDILEDKPGYRRIALSHYYNHDSGDMVPDPDMEVKVYKDKKEAEALTYQDMYRFEEGPNCQLDQFLLNWLSNLIQQGHK